MTLTIQYDLDRVKLKQRVRYLGQLTYLLTYFRLLSSLINHRSLNLVYWSTRVGTDVESDFDAFH